jgi:hypothetical protein
VIVIGTGQAAAGLHEPVRQFGRFSFFEPSKIMKEVQMLRSIKSLYGFKILAQDGDIGKLSEFLFDDETWTSRYLVVDTGNWLMDKKVLVSPVVFGQPDWETKTIPVLLNRAQLEDFPGIDKDQPVSRRHQTELFKYYGWQPYFSPGGMYGVPPPPPQVTMRKEPEVEEEEGDPHLRSTREVSGYHIQATDGEIGHVDDFIADDENWMIRYLVIDTRNWLPGRKVLVSPEWITRISWEENKVFVDLEKEKIKASPEFDPSRPVNREYETIFYDYYGRPHYWK